MLLIGIRELGDFALGLDQSFCFRSPFGHRGHDFRNAAHTGGQVAGHEIHAVGQSFQVPATPLHIGLAAQFPSVPTFARHARHFEANELS
jgi:hypothetical protein